MRVIKIKNQNEKKEQLLNEIDSVLGEYSKLKEKSKHGDLSDILEEEIYTLITQTLNIVRHLDNPDYYDQINEILVKNKPYLSKRFMSIMGILIAIRRNLATDLIAIKSNLNYENKIDVLTNFEDISIDFPKKMIDIGKTMTEVYFN
ncbi:hypothetical protein LCGC14_2393150, partial [marine sediment metagenome]